ncbi:MAG TPA: sulfite exporter TauE/SafE family protein [Clostridia bacterium]|nr:sulfite exporter TauE/SafE family protein [Clostridia bacterium]
MEAIIKSQSLNIGCMTCAGCQNTIEKALGQQRGVIKVQVSYQLGRADIQYDSDITSLDELVKTIEALGYHVLPEGGRSKTDYKRDIGLLLIIASLYMVVAQTGLINLMAPASLAADDMSYGMLFIIGLITSAHCVAMCGGINLSQCLSHCATDSQTGRWSAYRPGFMYNLGRVLSYTATGFVIGAAGTVFIFSNTVQGMIKLAAGVFMIMMGLNMLDIFPWMRRLNLSMPMSSGFKNARSSTKSPLVVGMLNGLMPCGPLQAMQLYALSTGSPLKGALSMLIFSLGTLPLMLGLGALGAMLTKKHLRQMMTAGAVLVAVLGLSMLSQGFSLAGVALPFSVPAGAADDSGNVKVTQDGVQLVASTLAPGRYPAITVQAGTPVKWVITAPKGSINGCNNRLYIPAYDITHEFELGENVISFTPDKTGTFQYSCWMGMIRGSITVVESGTPIDDSNENSNETVLEPSPSGYSIPVDDLTVAEFVTDSSGATVQQVDVLLTDQGFSPAVVVVQANTDVLWRVNRNTSSAAGDKAILIPAYATQLPLTSGENGFYFYPEQSFDFSTEDSAFFGYVKVVEDITAIDKAAIKEEVAAFETLIWPPETFLAGAGGSCCQ